MPYYRWRAYDNNALEYTGVDEAPRFELIALKLIQHQLQPASIETIEYDEYRRLHKASQRLDHLRTLKTKFSGPNDIKIPTRKTHSITIIKCVMILLIAMLSAVLLLFHYYR